MKQRLRSYCVIALAVAACAGCAHNSRYAYQSPYQQGYLSPGIKFLGLPDAVQATIRAQAGMSEILDIGRYEMHGGTFYKVWFVRDGSFPPLYIAPDGSILNSDLTVSMSAPKEKFEELAGHEFGTLSLADLPAAVVKTIKVEAPTFEIQRIQQSGTETNRVYEIQFKGKHARNAMSIDSSGRLIR